MAELDVDVLTSSTPIIPGVREGALKFTIAGLNKITDNFSERCKIGQGGSGTVYQGKLQDGTPVAIKRIKKDIFGIRDSKEFQTKARMLSLVNHPTLVTSMGIVEDEDEWILVTEFVTNGNLRQHLDGDFYGVVMDMKMRFQIAVDVASALQYYHSYFGSQDTIHIDIKSSNILITNDFHAKVAGIGISPPSASGDIGPSKQDKETSGDMDRKWVTKKFKREKNAVYSFGKLLVEIFTGRYTAQRSGPIDACSIHRQVSEQLAKRRLMDIIDPTILQPTADLLPLEKVFEQVFELVLSCLDPEEIHRPTIDKVWETLSKIRRKHVLPQSIWKAVQRGPEGTQGSDMSVQYLLPQHKLSDYSARLGISTSTYLSGLQASSALPGLKSVKTTPPSPDGALKFTIAGLNKITDNFSERCKIGQGGSGTVYQGKLQDGTTVAIKRIKKDIFAIRDFKEFHTEAVMLSQVNHRNLVRLMGIVEDEDELILVTEFVTNGNLRQHLDGVPSGVFRDMKTRFLIAKDVARALHYLHYYHGNQNTIHICCSKNAKYVHSRLTT